MLDAGQRVHLGFDGRRHEGREPPGHHLGPERRVYDVEGLQVLLVSDSKEVEFKELISSCLIDCTSILGISTLTASVRSKTIPI